MTPDGAPASWMSDPQVALDHIMRETGYDAVDAEVLRRELEGLHPQYRTVLTTWWTTGEIDRHDEVLGWSIQRLLDEGKSRYVCEALTWMSGLVVFPDDTLELLSMPLHDIVWSETALLAFRKNNAS